MRDLTRFLDNPFDDRGISVGELLAFSTDHLQRMIANNASAELSTRITATTSALQLVEDCVTDDGTKLAIRKSRKMAKDASRASLPDSISKIAGVVMGKFGQNSNEMTQCLPDGRSIFSTCRDDEVQGKLQITINGLTALQAALGAQIVTDATALKAAWVTVYNASESATGGKTTTPERQKTGAGKPATDALPQPAEAGRNVRPPARPPLPLHAAAPARKPRVISRSQTPSSTTARSVIHEQLCVLSCRLSRVSACEPTLMLPITRISAKSNTHETETPVVPDKTVAYSTLDVLDRIVFHLLFA